MLGSAGEKAAELPSGVRHWPGYFDASEQEQLVALIRQKLADAPLFTPAMPRTGKPIERAHDEFWQSGLGNRQGKGLSLPVGNTLIRGRHGLQFRKSCWICGQKS